MRVVISYDTTPSDFMSILQDICEKAQIEYEVTEDEDGYFFDLGITDPQDE